VGPSPTDGFEFEVRDRRGTQVPERDDHGRPEVGPVEKLIGVGVGGLGQPLERDVGVRTRVNTARWYGPTVRWAASLASGSGRWFSPVAGAS